MRRRLSPAAVLLLSGLCACDSEGNFIYAEPGAEDFVYGLWIGSAEITTAEDPGSGPTLGSRGFSFPIALNLGRNGQFQLNTVNFPALYDSDTARTCEGIFSRKGTTIEFFANRACRALPLSKYTLGRTLPGGMSLQASTANLPTYTPATIKVHLRLSRE